MRRSSCIVHELLLLSEIDPDKPGCDDVVQLLVTNVSISYHISL